VRKSKKLTGVLVESFFSKKRGVKLWLEDNSKPDEDGKGTDA